MVYKRFTENQLGTIRSIIDFASGDQEVLGLTVDTTWGINKFHIAYILATAEWESGFKPIKEIGGKNKPYAPYYGRGYVQLTHKENYEKYGTLLGLDLVGHPEITLQPDVSLVVLVHGMAKGRFTGKKLNDYIKDADHKDYVNARRIVNGTDQAAKIAALTEFWEGYMLDVNTIGSDAAPAGE